MSDTLHTLLLVDDDPDIVALLSKTLAPHYRILGACSGVEALGFLANNTVATVVTDQKMPGMTGVQLAREVHREDTSVSVVLLTAYTDPADVIAAINEGEVFRYVTKPWNVTDLLIAVKSAVERTLLSRDNRRLVGALNRQMSAISLVGSVGRDVGVTGGTLDVLAHLMRRLPGVLEFNLGAALVCDGEKDSRPIPLMHIYSANSASERALLRARDRVLELFEKASGRAISVGEVVVRVSGSEETTGFDEVGSEVAVSVVLQGRPLGMLCLWSAQENQFGAEDGRLLEVLANETAVLLQQQREVVEQERRHFSLLMSSLVDGVIVAKPDGTLSMMNSAARGFLGLFPDQNVEPSQVWETLGYSPRNAIDEFETRGPAPVRFASEILGRPLEGVAAPVFDGQRRLSQIALTLRDTSESRRLERTKDEVIATVSHELRTPLTAVMAALDLFVDQQAGKLGGEGLHYIDTAREGCDRLTVLLNDILDLAKDRSGELAVRLAPVDVEPVIARMVDSLRPAAQKRGVKIHLDCRPGLSCQADANRLEQVVVNLVSNAVKFANKGSTIEVKASLVAVSPPHVLLSVWNEGPEIPKNEQALIFRRFEQGSTAALSAQKGSGLGLSISASLVEAHGGWIHVDSGDGRGTTFSVALPVERPAADGSWLGAVEAFAPLQGLRLLIVDDDALIAHFLSGWLGRLGLDVKVSIGGDDALALARKSPFDLIITDIRMPDVDGLVLTETLRHDPQTRRVPVIVYSVMEQAEAARRAGASAFVIKPIDLGAFKDRVRALLEQRTQGETPVVLVCDPDAAFRRLASQVLSNLGHRVLEVERLVGAQTLLAERRVDILLLAQDNSEGDGVEWFEAWRKANRTHDMGVLFLAARNNTADKVRAFHAGADDYLVQPVDALELAARVDNVLRRREREVAASPTTRLPGGHAIEREVQARIETGEAFLLCYFDIDNLKAFNDFYGYAKTDAVIQQTGDILREVVAIHGTPQDFVGHIAGDDFVCVFSRERGEQICEQVIRAFDKIIPLYYDGDDRRRGYIETEDRYGASRQFPIMSISVAAIVVQSGGAANYAHLASQAASLKKQAKSISGSAFVVSQGGPGVVRAHKSP